MTPGARSGNVLADLWRDLRYGARMLRRQPGFTAATVLTLALAIGATTAIFTVIDAALLRPLPFPQADRLAQVGRGFQGSFSWKRLEAEVLHWRRESR